MSSGAVASMPRLLAAAVVVALVAVPAAAQQPIDFSKVEIKTTDLGRGLYQMDSAGGNLLVLTGPDGVLLVDDSYAQLYDKITAAVRRVSDRPIKYVINSHIHGDHHGGNEAMIKAGVTVIAHEKVRSRMATGGRDAFSNQPIPPAVPGALPIVTYRDAMTVYFNGETIDLIHAPPSHTDSDTIVYFRNANVIFVGGNTVRLAAALPSRGPAVPVTFGLKKSRLSTSVQDPSTSDVALMLYWKLSLSDGPASTPLRHCSPV